MKQPLRIFPKVSTWVGNPSNGYHSHVCDDGDFLEPDPDVKHTITKIGVRINAEEPKETYSIYALLLSMKPGWKGDYQSGYSWDEFLTCSCGNAGCAGYFDGIHIHRKKNTVRVFGSKKHGYSEGPFLTGDDVVFFDKEEYDSVREYFLTMFKNDPGGIFQDNDLFFTGRYGIKVFG